MSDPLCLDCLFKRGDKNTLKETRFTIQCPTCKHNLREEDCEDGCGKVMCFCQFFGYWHNARQPKSCFGYDER